MVHTLQLPAVKTEQESENHGVYVIEPLHSGFGVTLGNSLRRVLLTSLSGSAITAFKVEGAAHEFTTLPGVREDVVAIMLNLKEVRFRMHTDESQRLTINKKGGVVTAADIETNADIEVVNPDQHIATLDSDKDSLKMEVLVERGRGYILVDDRQAELEVGMIAIDALFSPIRKVRYKVENTRVGQMTNLDKVTLDITTDGSIAPLDALQNSAGILVEQFGVIAGEQTYSLQDDVPAAVEEEVAGSGELDMSVEDLALSPRTQNALINNNIHTVRELAEMNPGDLKTLKGFGAKAMTDVTEKLQELGIW